MPVNKLTKLAGIVIPNSKLAKEATVLAEV
jgi:hypothetical protein